MQSVMVLLYYQRNGFCNNNHFAKAQRFFASAQNDKKVHNDKTTGEASPLPYNSRTILPMQFTQQNRPFITKGRFCFSVL